MGWIFRLASKVGLDQNVVSGLMARIIPMSIGPISSIITVWTLTKEKQGLFYLFGSLVALRSLFELGAGTSVMQIAAHARQEAELAKESPLEPAFVVTVNRWMGRIALIFGTAVAAGGSIFLTIQGHGDASTLTAWLAFLAISVFQFSSEGRWALLEGSNRMAEANRLRLRNSLIQYGAQWALLFSGAGLFAFVGASVAAFASQEFVFHRRYGWLYAKPSAQDPARLSHFRGELVTLIKRASLTYLTGYFVFQIQQPICFHLLGTEGSVRLGFTQTIGGTLVSLSSLWVAMNFPRIAHSVADNRIDEGWTLFRSRSRQTLVLAILGALGAWTVTLLLAQVPRFAERLMDPVSTLILYSGLATQAVGLSMTYWPRAFKVEPFVRIAYVQMIATPILLWTCASFLGLRGIAVAILGTWVIGFVGILLISRPYLNRARVDAPAGT
jgi:hypothetical protein